MTGFWADVGADDGVTSVAVAAPGGAYQVTVGPGLLHDLGRVLPPVPHARRAALVTAEPVDRLHGATVRAGLDGLGLDVLDVVVPDGEAAKTPAVAERCWQQLADAGVGRGDLVVGLGGGSVTDLAGFVAAGWHRGVGVVHLPTTLLGQVDAAVGGKTGVNLPQGKNLVGAFHQPLAVVADIATLATLPLPELASGLGEACKYAFVADPGMGDILLGDPAGALAGEPEVLAEVVHRGVLAKADAVAADERDQGRRALLNYGHTFGHAFEAVAGYGELLHGHAVAAGMVAAARLSERLGVSRGGWTKETSLADDTVELLAMLGLPTGDLGLDPVAVWEAMTRDKKARDGVRFVLCRRPGDAFLSAPVERGAVLEVLATLA